MSKQLKKVSKYLSFLLRHQPESIGLVLDEQGWASVEDLLNLTDIDRPLLEEVVFTNDKQRFAFSSDGLKIRANQGHSLEGVELELAALEPPDRLYHGTVERFLESILEQGLRKMDRHHVHLSATIDTAKNVGSRRGKPVVLIVDAQLMAAKGRQFFLSANGVWLVDSVPAEYLSTFSH